MVEVCQVRGVPWWCTMVEVCQVPFRRCAKSKVCQVRGVPWSSKHTGYSGHASSDLGDVGHDTHLSVLRHITTLEGATS